MFNVIEISLNLLLHPKSMATSFKRRYPSVESLIFLILLISFGALYGLSLSNFSNGKLYLASLITLVSIFIALFSIFIYFINLNMRIFGGKIKYLTLFFSLFFLFGTLLLFVKLPSLIILSLFKISHTTSYINMYINIFLLFLFIIYSLIIMSVLYEMEIWRVFMSYILIAAYSVLFIAVYKLSFDWIKSTF